MRPWNFPAKKDARRIRAIARGLSESVEAATRAALLTDPRAIRTKKRRAAR